MWPFPDYPLTLAGRDIPRGTYVYDHKASWWPDPTFYAIVVGSAIASGVLRSVLRKQVIDPLAQRMQVEKSAQKLEESVMQVLFYTFAWTFNTMFLVKQDWFWFPILTFLEGFPNQTIDPEIFWFYGIQTGWYVYCSYAHVFQDSRKSDYWIMIVHHAVTLTLLYAAFVTGYFRIGMLVMFSMDICDIFVFSAKTLKTLDRDSTIHPAFYLAVYATLPTVWVAFRLLYFPYVVLHTTVVGTIKVFGWEGIKGWVPYNALLLILFALNIFWFYQIVRIGILSLRNGTQSMDDIREKARNSPPATAALKHHQQQDQQVLPPQKEPLSPALATTSKRAAAAARGKAKAAS